MLSASYMNWMPLSVVFTFLFLKNMWLQRDHKLKGKPIVLWGRLEAEWEGDTSSSGPLSASLPAHHSLRGSGLSSEVSGHSFMHLVFSTDASSKEGNATTISKRDRVGGWTWKENCSYKTGILGSRANEKWYQLHKAKCHPSSRTF